MFFAKLPSEIKPFALTICTHRQQSMPRGNSLCLVEAVGSRLYTAEQIRHFQRNKNRRYISAVIDRRRTNHCSQQVARRQKDYLESSFLLATDSENKTKIADENLYEWLSSSDNRMPKLSLECRSSQLMISVFEIAGRRRRTGGHNIGVFGLANSHLDTILKSIELQITTFVVNIQRKRWKIAMNGDRGYVATTELLQIVIERIKQREANFCISRGRKESSAAVHSHRTN